MDNKKSAIRLIDKLYKDLYKDLSVIRSGNGNIYDKFNNIESYIDKLEKVHNKVSNTGRHIDYLKKCYYDKYVIKREDIPESYYNMQVKIALERGYGHIELTDEIKKELQDEVIENQQARIDTWLDYFLSDDSSVYPFWSKYWAFQGMLKLGKYDKEKGVFHKRTKDTVEPFVDLNREALSMSIDLIIKMLNKEEIEDKELDILVKSGSFQKIYSYILTRVLNNNKNIIKRNIGRWIKYNKGSDHMPLVNSLRGYNTEWCTAGESTAKTQLSNGDFYVYYTLDENDEYKVPRIAIRMENNKIGEIRGVALDQNLESEMEEIVEEKIKEFPDREEYYKKVNDMKSLTKIYNKYKNNEELVKEELRFLYEIDSNIIGFGYKKDPRIEEITDKRNKRRDFSLIFNCREDQIALNRQEMKKDTIYYYGDLDLNGLTSAEGLVLPQNIGGNLDLRGLTSAKGLVLPQSIGWVLYLSGLKSAKGLELPQSIGGSLYLRSLTSAKGLELPQNIGGSLDLSGLTSAKGLVLPQSIGGFLDLNGLTSAKGLVLPQSIGGFLDLNGLTSAKGLVLPQSIGGSLDLSGLRSIKGLVLPQSIGGSLYLRSLTSAEGLVLPQNIGGSLYLSSLASAEGLELPQSIRGSLDLSGLTSIERLVLPQSIGGYLDLSGLKSAEGLVFPQNIGGSLYLDGLTSAEGLVLPQSIGEALDLSGLRSIKGLVLPQSIGGSLYLRSLTSAEGLVLPQNIGGSLYLSSLASAEGLELPQSIGGYLDLSGLKSAEGLVFPQNIGGSLSLDGLTSAEGLVLPQSIGEALYLDGLTSAEGLIIPDPLNYTIYMNEFKITPENVDMYRKNNKSL